MIKIEVNIANHKYPVFIRDGLLDSPHAYYKITNDCLLITDVNIPKTAIEKVLKSYPIKHVIKLPQGEQNKSLSTYEMILKEMLENGFNKATTVIALGGGVIGDLAGFIASTFYRGVDFVQIPTTLLSMVDSSIGGKVAINIDHYKNMVGAFYQPKAVLIDPFVLSTLPHKELMNGYAEIIKIALIRDKKLFEQLKQPHDINEIIAKAITLKKDVVVKDTYDQNIRNLLNYGHTIGHALETIHFPNFLHGECIAYGMRLMAKGTAFEEELLDVLKKYQLDMEIPYDKNTLYSIILKDKKLKHNTLTIALVEEVGNGFIKTIDKESFKFFL
ncbi:MAG: 3-dehydroquinate synthase [Candidatus Izemoplasmataceae bacterium]